MAERSILDVSLGSEYVSDYPEAFSIIINWGFYFEFFINFSNLISILLKYLEQESFPVFQTCQNFTIKNNKGFY